MAFWRVLQLQSTKQGRITDPARVEGVSEDAESFPRRLPRDYSNEPGKVVFVASLGGGPLEDAPAFLAALSTERPCFTRLSLSSLIDRIPRDVRPGPGPSFATSENMRVFAVDLNV